MKCGTGKTGTSGGRGLHRVRYGRCVLGRVDREVGPGTEGREMAVADVAKVVRASGGMFQGCRCRLVGCFVAYDANVGFNFLKVVCVSFLYTLGEQVTDGKEEGSMFVLGKVTIRAL